MSSRYKIFMKVLECRSFSIASKEIGYSQSAVSQAMKSLEEELQTTLFKRNQFFKCVISMFCPILCMKKPIAAPCETQRTLL